MVYVILSFPAQEQKITPPIEKIIMCWSLKIHYRVQRPYPEPDEPSIHPT